MPQLFDFADMFAEWETEFERIPSTGGARDYGNGGKWTAGFADPETMTGIIVPLSRDDLSFDAGGTFTQRDRKVYMQLPAVLAINDRISYEGFEYRIMGESPYEEYADFNVYFAKRFDPKGSDSAAPADDDP